MTATASLVSPQRLRLPHGELAWLEAGSGPPLVLLHGIGACAQAFEATLEAFASSHRVLAWDAPGYGDSAPLTIARPLAADYADVALAWFEALGLQAPVLLGHSLGALIAAAIAARAPASLAPRRLLLCSPAQGYGDADEAVRAQRFDERVEALRTLGIAGLAAQRSARLLAPGASAAVQDAARRNMQRITERGYPQAAWMLAHDAIDGHLAAAKAPLAVLCGALDRVTPPEGARALAQRHGAPLHELPAVAHLCYLEDPAQFHAVLRECL